MDLALPYGCKYSLQLPYIIFGKILRFVYKCIKYRNFLGRLKQIKKKEYFHNKITSFKGDSKWLWKFSNGYIYRQIDKNNILNSLNVNDIDVTEKREIADNLNLHFSTVGKEVSKKF